jgi:hypothetical protein
MIHFLLCGRSFRSGARRAARGRVSGQLPEPAFCQLCFVISDNSPSFCSGGGYGILLRFVLLLIGLKRAFVGFFALFCISFCSLRVGFLLR